MSGEAPNPGYESFKEKIDPEFSKALDKAADFVTHNVDLIINGQLIEHPFEGTFTTAAVVTGARVTEGAAPELMASAAAKRKSEHLEDVMDYGPLDEIAFKKAAQILEVASKVDSEKLHTSDVQTAGALIESGTEHAYMGGTGIDDNEGTLSNFIIGTSGGEGSRDLIQAMFPGETFDFDGDPTQLERGAGLVDEVVSRLVGSVLVMQTMGLKLPEGEERINMELTQLQPNQVARTEALIKEVPDNQKPDGGQRISID